jgi:hypothetical protein
MNWTPEDIKALPYIKRPRVRCAYQRVNINSDGVRSAPFAVKTEGQIIVDGNNPWVVISASGHTRELRVSWDLVCQVLNDPYAPPIDSFPGEPIQYEI